VVPTDGTPVATRSAPLVPQAGTAPIHHQGRDPIESAIRSTLRRELGSERYSRYFDEGTRLAYADGDLVVTLSSPFLAEQVKRRFQDPIRRAAETAIEGRWDPAEVRVRFCVDRDRTGRTPRVTEGPSAPGRQHQHPAPSAPRRPPRRTAGPRHATLDEWVVGPANRLAHETACRIADARAPLEFSKLVVHGDCGVGKTHLLWGIVTRFRILNPRARALYTTAEAFTNAFVDSVRAGRVDALRARHRRLDLLCLDDVHFLPKRRGTQDELLHTLDALECSGARLVLASDAHPRRVPHLSPALVSRCVSGLVVEIAPPDIELSTRLIASLGHRHGLRFEPAAAARLARAAFDAQARPSVRDLEGLVTRVAAYAGLLERPAGAVDEALVRRAIGAPADPAGTRARRPGTIDESMQTVCSRRASTRTYLLGRGRHKRVVFGRELVTHLGRRLTSLSFPEIARALGRTSHSTFVQAERRLRRALEENASIPSGLTPDLPRDTALDSFVEELVSTLSRSRSR